jgi:hypothetical protein
MIPILSSSTTAGNELQVISTSPADGSVDVEPESLVVITFDQEIDFETVKESVSFSPAMEFDFRILEKDLTLIPYTLLEIETTYTVTISTDLKSVSKAHLSSSYAFAFTTRKLQEFPPEEEPEKVKYTWGNVYIEEPAETRAETAAIILRAPVITSSKPDKYPPRWRLHFKVDAYSDPEHIVLIESVSSQSNPEEFEYSTNHGATWRAFPPDGLPPAQYGSNVRVNLHCGRGAQAYIIPSFGAEPA